MALGKTDFTADNLVTATKQIITGDLYTLASGQSVVRGQVLKLTGTALSSCLTTEDPNTIALQTVDATSGALPITYMISGSALESEMTFNTGDADEFREALRSFGIITE